jgi:hypothetical protein
MSVYTQFVKEHIHSAPGKTMKDKMRAVGAMWRRHKGKGKGLTTPGFRSGGNTWTDYGMKPALNGEGLWDDVKSVGKKALKFVGKKAVDFALSHGAPALIKKVGTKSPAIAALLQKALDHGGKPLQKLIHSKIEGMGIRHARAYLKHHMSIHPPKGRSRGGGLVSPRQMAALRKHIRGSM